MALKSRESGRTEKQVLSQVLEAAAMLGIDLQRENTGAALNPQGKMVRFGRPGRPDTSGTLPDGRTLKVEIKREGFNPSKLSGAKREHFEKQLDEMKKINSSGGVSFWIDDAGEFLQIIRAVLAGASVYEPGYGRPIVYRNGVKG